MVDLYGIYNLIPVTGNAKIRFLAWFIECKALETYSWTCTSLSVIQFDLFFSTPTILLFIRVYNWLSYLMNRVQ